MLGVDLGCRCCLAEELLCVGGAFSGVFVLDVGVHIDAVRCPVVDSFSPIRELRGRVLLAAQAQVSEGRGEDFRRRLLVGLGEAERNALLPQDGVGFLRVPGGVAHFKSKGKCRRAKAHEIFEQLLVEFEGWRQLNEDRAQVVSFGEHAARFQEALEDALAIAQPENVRDLLVGFQREPEPFGNALRPLLEQVFRRHAIKAVIDFDGLELPRIVGEHLAVGKVLRVKAPLPRLVGVAGSAHAKLPGLRNRTPPRIVI